MQKTVMVTRTDAIDQVMALTGGETPVFSLPAVPGGAHIQVYDTPARGTAYTCDYSPYRPGDFVIRRAEATGDAVRIAAVAGGRLAEAESVYVVTRGNCTQVEATVEVYGGEEDGNG